MCLFLFLTLRNETPYKLSHSLLVTVICCVFDCRVFLCLSVILVDEIGLYLMENFGLSLLYCFNGGFLGGVGVDYSLDLLVKEVPIDHSNLVVDPVISLFVERLYKFIVLLGATFMIIIDKIEQVSHLKDTSNPVLLESVLQNPITLKHIRSELANVRVPVFEDPLAESIQLPVHIISLLNQSQLELIRSFRFRGVLLMR